MGDGRIKLEELFLLENVSMCLLGQKMLDGKCLGCVKKNLDVCPLELENDDINILVCRKTLVFGGDYLCF